MKNFYIRFMAILINCLLIFPMVTTTLVRAAPLPADECTEAKLRDLGVAIVACKEPSACETSASTGTGKVFVLGDSLTVGMRDSGVLESKLTVAGNTVTQIDGTVGTSIPSSIPKIDADAANVTSATKIVIELGTNDGSGITADSINQRINDMVSKVKSVNPTAQIYWVNIHSTKSNYSVSNTAIATQSTTLGYRVIDWDKYATSNLQPGDFDSSLGVHPNGDGYSKMSDLVVQSISTASTSGVSGASCCPNTNLNGGDNPAKIFNYLVSKGLTPPQAAGIMGNLQAESHFDPTIEQAPGAWSDMSGAYHKAVGIAQWDGGRRVTIVKAAEAQKKDPKDLGFQLDYLFQEATARGDWERLKQTATAADAALSWHKYFEVSDDGPDKIQGRINNANNLLVQYGSGTPTDTSSTTTTTGCGASGPFSYGKYASLSRQQLIDLIYGAPNWKPQNNRSVIDINSGVATDNLLRLLAALIENVSGELITPSVIQTGHSCRTHVTGNISNHMGGLAVDLGGNGHSRESMVALFNFLFTNREALGINELIYDPVPSGTSTLKHGKPLGYDSVTLGDHRDHIHVSVEGPRPTTCPAGT